MSEIEGSMIKRRFGRLVVIDRADDYVSPKGIHYPKWLCECDCEKHTRKSIRESHLLSGATQSCGCLQKERASLASRKSNEYTLDGECGILWSTNTNEEVYFDLDDADNILQYTWFIGSDGYPTANIDGKSVRMHVFLGCNWHDHFNRNKRDNRRGNLIPCTQAENNRNRPISKLNTSGVMGVFWHSKAHKWQANLIVDGKFIYLGLYMNKDDAIRIRLDAERKYFGKFAPQRHLFEQYNIIDKYED